MAERKRRAAPASDDKRQRITVPVVQAKDYRVAVADGADVTAMTEGPDVTLQVSFTRKEVVLKSESFDADIKDDEIQPRGPIERNQDLQKTVEFGVMLRPDHAFQVAHTLLRVLGRLNDDIRNRYKLPQVDFGGDT